MNAVKKLPAFKPEEILARPAATGLRDLLKVACEASDMDWGRLTASALCGCPARAHAVRRYSEYNILNPWRARTLAGFLMDLSIPALPESTPDLARMLLPPVVNRRFWRPTSFFRQPDEYAGVCSFPKEHWFFINGIATNADVARYNSAYLAHLFHRPVTVVQNATCSLPADLLECMLGKGLRVCDRNIMTEPAWRAATAVLEALNAEDIQHVIVIAHSQGTIIVSNVLATIEEALNSDLAMEKEPEWHAFTKKLMGKVETESQKALRNGLAHALAEFTRDRSKHVMDRLRKLEVFTFANCADRMQYVHESAPLPYMEHYANEFDWVARLGILSPLRGDGGSTIEIDGPLFEQKGEWGHLLNEHYLMAIDDFLYPGAEPYNREEDPFPPRGNGGTESRLYQYFHGNSPDPLWA
jgi:pimeloyl-ACP methyl ester carboxylesterase